MNSRIILYALKSGDSYLKVEGDEFRPVDMAKASVYPNAASLMPMLGKAPASQEVYAVELTITERRIEL